MAAVSVVKELIAAVITGFYLLFLISVSGCSSLPLVFLEPNEWLSFQPLVSSAALSVPSFLPHDIETALLPALPPVLSPSHLVGKYILSVTVFFFVFASSAAPSV